MADKTQGALDKMHDTKFSQFSLFQRVEVVREPNKKIALHHIVGVKIANPATDAH